MGLDAPQVEETTVKIFNVPNLLSLSRILAVPVFIVLMLEPSPVARPGRRHRVFHSHPQRTGSTATLRGNGGR